MPFRRYRTAPSGSILPAGRRLSSVVPGALARARYCHPLSTLPRSPAYQCPIWQEFSYVGERPLAATWMLHQENQAVAVNSEVTEEFLDAFAAAWSSHDVEAILAAMTPDCVYQQSAGPDVDGNRFTGHSATRRAIEGLFTAFPDARWNNPTHFVAGNRGVSEWVFTGTGPNGPVEVQGCDVFTFRGGLIAIKNSFRKQRTP
jgi:ketosteroid isomerase-like protein